MRDQLVERMRSLLDGVAKDMAAIVEQHIDRAIAGIEEAFHVALSAAASDLGAPEGADVVGAAPSVEVAKTKRVRAVTPETYPPSRRARTDRSAPQANGKKPATCKACGYIGGNARGCGRSHPTQPREVATPPAKATVASDDAEEEPRAPRRRKSRAGEPAEEPPVIPHAALVAMLAADRANNAVGDLGGFVARADRGPSLVGHTEEKRELCGVHGWVGRVAFEREQHDLCAPTGEPCHRCKGRKVVLGDFCGRCDGSGIEPVKVEIAPPVIEEPQRPIATPTYTPARSYMKDGVRVRAKRSAPRAKTVAVESLTRVALERGAIEVDLAGPLVDEHRPRTRGECAPCPTCQEYVDARRLEHSGAAIRPTNGDSPHRDTERRSVVDGDLRLRAVDHDARKCLEVGEYDELRLQSHEARTIENRAVSTVVDDDRALRASDSNELRGIRRPGDPGLPALEDELRGVRGGCGAASVDEAHTGSQGPERELRARQRAMGDADRTAAEQAQQSPSDGRRSDAHGRRVESADGHRIHDDHGENASRVVTLACGHRTDEAWNHSRPCVRVSCKHSLYLDINPETGSIKLNFPDVEPWELVESCALDAAERGGLVLEDVAVLMNLTRERVRQVELAGFHALKARPEVVALDTGEEPEGDAA